MLLNDFPTFPRYKFLRNPKFQVPNHPTLLEKILQKLHRPPQQPQTSDHVMLGSPPQTSNPVWWAGLASVAGRIATW